MYFLRGYVTTTYTVLSSKFEKVKIRGLYAKSLHDYDDKFLILPMIIR